MKLSERQLEALMIIKNNNKICARDFGLLFWENHKAHRELSKVGNGVVYGKKGWLMAGSYLSKLRVKELVSWNDGYYRLTFKGLKELQNETRD